VTWGDDPGRKTERNRKSKSRPLHHGRVRALVTRPTNSSHAEMTNLSKRLPAKSSRIPRGRLLKNVARLSHAGCESARCPRRSQHPAATQIGAASSVALCLDEPASACISGQRPLLATLKGLRDWATRAVWNTTRTRFARRIIFGLGPARRPWRRTGGAGSLAISWPTRM